MTRAPRLLVVSSHAKLGGSEQVLQDLAGHLREQVVEVVLLEHGPLEERLRSDGFAVSVLPVSARPHAAVLASTRLRRRLAALQPDVVHANGVKAALVCALTLTRVPIVWMKHDVSLDGALGRLIASRCARVAGVSTEVLRGLPGRTNTVVVHPGATVDPDRAARGGRELRRSLGLEGPVLCVIGRLDPAKGHGELLAVMPQVLRAQPTAHALLVGGDDPHHPGHRRALQAAADRHGVADRVHLLGHLPAEEVLAAADVALVPTVPHPDGAGREGFGLIALQALALGVPVAGYDVGATLEVVGPCGMLVPPGDRAALGEAVMGLLRDPARADAARRCGRARAEGMTVARMVDRLAEVYREVER